MIRPRIIFLLAVSLAFAGCNAGESPDSKPQPREPSYIYVLMETDDRPRLDYEGDGLLKQSEVQLSPGDNRFGFEFIAFELPPGATYVAGGTNDDPKNHIVEFTGSIVRSGDDGFSLNGTLRNKVPVVIQFVKMVQTNDKSGEEFPELSFDVGRHSVEFTGKVTGWYED